MGEKMTKDQFEEKLCINGGQFEFNTNIYEGMIGITPSKIVIWVDKVGYSNSENEDEPKYIGEFESVEELLDTFMVADKSFAKSVLPEIASLIPILSY